LASYGKIKEISAVGYSIVDEKYTDFGTTKQNLLGAPIFDRDTLVIYNDAPPHVAAALILNTDYVVEDRSDEYSDLFGKEIYTKVRMITNSTGDLYFSRTDHGYFILAKDKINVSRRNCVLTGPESGGDAVYTSNAAGQLTILEDTVVTFADGAVDDEYTNQEINFVYKFQSNTSPTNWDISGETNGRYYFYIDIKSPWHFQEQMSDALEYGFTDLPPIHDLQDPTSPSTGQYYWNVTKQKSFEWSGSAWVEVIRVFIAEATLTSNVLSARFNYDFGATTKTLNTKWISGGEYLYTIANEPNITSLFSDSSAGYSVDLSTYVPNSAMTVTQFSYTLDSDSFVRLTTYPDNTYSAQAGEFDITVPVDGQTAGFQDRGINHLGIGYNQHRVKDASYFVMDARINQTSDFKMFLIGFKVKE
jgi:hypothetical protein